MNLLRTLGLARLPPEADSLIPPDLRQIVSENLSCDITLRKFSAPGRVCNWKRQWFAGSIAVAENRIVAFRWRKRIINTNFDDPRFDKISFTIVDHTLIVSHDAALYRDDWSGSIEYRFRTPDAERIADLVHSASRVPVTAPF